MRQDLGQDFLKKDSPKPQVLSSTIEKSDAKSDLKSDIPIIYIDTKNINDDLFGELRRYAETKGIILEKKTGSSQYDALDNTYDRRNSLDKSPEKNITNASNDSSDLKKIYGSAISTSQYANGPENDYNKLKTLSDIKKLRLERQSPEKKVMIIKEISKVLTDIEELKRTKKIIYFSDIVRKKVYDITSKQIGYLKDLAISGGDRFPEVSHIYVARGKEEILIPWSYVMDFSKTVRLTRQYPEVEKRELKEDDILLGVNILDQQVVDVNGLKVIRVNDIALTLIKSRLAVVNIDIGNRSMIRRLGYEKLFDLLHINVKDHPVPWSSIEPLTGSVERIHLKVSCPRVADLHPADVAELFDELSMIERTTLLKSMKAETAAKVILECEPEVQKSIMKSLKLKRLASIFEKMSASDVANIVTDFDSDKLAILLNLMTKEIAIKIQELLSYKEDSVARYMSESFITISPDLTVGTATDYVRSLSKYPTNFHYIYVVDESDILVGVMSLKQLVVADANALIKNVMITKLISVDINYPIEYVEELISKYDLMALPVIDVNGKMRGIINIDEVLNVVMERNKKKESFELTEEQKDDLMKARRIKEYYSTLVKEMGQFVKDLESIKPKKQDYINNIKPGFMLPEKKGWLGRK